MNDRDGVAVIGIACRLPGAHNPAEFWALLRDGRDAVTEMPPERWRMLGLSGPDQAPDVLRRGGFLDEVDRFDANFFGIAPREATAMDPQQRLALELCWEAIEDAGILTERLAHSQTGVYVGAIAADYAELAQGVTAEALARQTFTGTQRSIIANRVSYALGLRGPSMTVDTGQSSSLVAVHLACQSLLTGESELAIAGGVHLNLGLHRALALAQLGALSPDGRCFTFDARANGFVRGEGGAVIVLKPLARALADGDRIHCVIRGSAVNNDGGGDGLTAPDQAAQEQMLAAAYAHAGIAPDAVGYVELHGTGTPLGDKVEAAALGRVIGAGRPADAPLAVGSVKTNVGHLEAAAGIAGLLKAALALEHREIPASLNFERRNPEIPLEAHRLRVQTEATPWPSSPRPIAGVSSFGIGGTNGHVVLEAAPAAAPGDADDQAPARPVPFVLSAKSASALRGTAERLAEHLAADAAALADVASSLITTRTPFSHRAVLIATTQPELDGALHDLAGGEPSAHIIEGVADSELAAEAPVFVFPGQGGQWRGMAVELIGHSEVFAAHLRECEAALSEHVEFSVEAVLREDPEQPSIARTEVVQPVLFAVMVALAELWRSYGVRPAAVIGHSQGEIAAAHVAGALSLEDAARIVALRSRALAAISGRGGMMSVSLAPDALDAHTADLGDGVVVAAINGPADLVVSGDIDALDELLCRCEAAGVRAKRLPVDYASHSPHIDGLREQLLEQFGPVAPRAANVPLYSTTTGERIDTSTMDAGYWYRNLRQTVRFAPATAAALGDGRRTFIEVSPHPVLTVPIESIAEQVLGAPDMVAALATLRRDQGGSDRWLASLAELYVRGGDVDFSAVFAGSNPRTVRLPTYAFQRERYWIDGAPRSAPVSLTDPAAEPDAPAEREAPSAGGETSFAARVLALAGAERRQVVLDAVRGQAAAVLGHASGADVDARATFKDLGFDSPATVELRNRVNRLAGLRLATTVLFDNPTPAGLADRVLAELTGATSDPGAGQSLAREGAAATADEPVAIVGMACRFPGGVHSPEDLWSLVAAGGDAIGEFPADRGWDLERLFDPDGERLGTTYVRHGGFLYDAGEFDAEHFGISPREALAMDPQQRLLLECSWEALEQAGIDPLSLHGSATGVFTGVMAQEYGPPLSQPDDRSDGYALTGTEVSVASGRVAYVLGLEGPTVSVDTACSSSLVALHLACQALRAGECSMALAGGATVMASPGIFVEFSRQRGLSPDGRCRAFGAGADGTGWGEGAGVLVLERLSDAEARGHRVLAVVRGTAINQDGASNGLTAPSGRSQERVIHAALATADLDPSDVDAVEAHGTGTTLGDPIEAQALIGAYGRGRSNGPLRLGSLKSNVGHTQAAAGVGGVIKMVQALRHEQLPPTLYVEEPSPHVDWADSGIELLAESVPWPRGERVRRAAVSSFGISGTNAHVVLEEAPAPVAADTPTPAPVPSRVLPFVLAASSDAGLLAQAGRLSAFIDSRDELDPTGLAGSLARTRAQLPHRAVAVVSGLSELADCLRAFERGEFVDGLIQGVARRDVRVGFVFPGQGGQWPGMAVELWDASAPFAAAMQECAAALREYADWSLEDVLRGAPGAPTLERVDVVQPALFAVMVSLASLWRSFGVTPSAVIGHSQGEIAAAYVAGVLSLDDASRIVAARSRLMRDTLSGGGGMVSMAASLERATDYLERFDGRISVAAVNGPSAVVVSGEPDALEELLAIAEADDVRARRLPVDYAAHSAQIELSRTELLAELAPVTPRPAEIALYSTVTGERLDGEAMDAEYWYRNLRDTVRFDAAVRAMAQDGVGALIETSPHPVLTAAALETVDAAETTAAASLAALGSLRRDDGGLERFISSLAEAHVHGLTVDWTQLFGAPRAPSVPLPTYAFQRRRYWLERGSGPGAASASGITAAGHPLLDAVLTVAGSEETVFTGRLSLDRQPWLADHVVMGRVLLPATGFIECALHAGAHTGAETIEELMIAAPLLFAEGTPVLIQVTVAPAAPDGTRRLAIYSRPDAPKAPDAAGDHADWTEHATGTLAPSGDTPPPLDDEWAIEDGEAADVADVYGQLAAAGYDYGPAFQGLRRLARGREDTLALVALHDELADRAEAYHLHPVLLDSALQALMLGRIDGAPAGRPQVPFAFAGIRLHHAGAVAARARISADGRLRVTDDADAPVLSIDSVQTRAVDPSTLGAATRDLYEVRWSRLPAASASSGAEAPTTAVLGESPVGEALSAAARYPDLAALERAVAAGAAVPDRVIAGPLEVSGDEPLTDVVHDVTDRALALLKEWLASEHIPDGRLVLLTRHAVAVDGGDAPDLEQGALPGLLRTARTEHPDRFALLDLGGGNISPAVIEAALTSGEPEIAIRHDVLFAPRLARVDAAGPRSRAVAGEAWHVTIDNPGTLENLTIAAHPRAEAPLAPGEVRVAVHAAGLNFKDVVRALGVVPPDGTGIGLEGAGVVLEVGADVRDLHPGDRVMGFIPDAFGPVAVADGRLLAPIPASWSFPDAASVPAVFVTAYHALVDIASVQPGETVLIHGAAGGVGMAALQLARHLGAETFATAHPRKWPLLTERGLDAEHIASSRDLDFRAAFLAATDSRGVDVVLDSLAGELVDASLELLPRGGRFVEIGKTDIRDPTAVAAAHPGVAYTAFDILQVPPERLGEMLREIVTLFERGVLHHLPVTTWDVRRAPDAFRFMREARHTGKIVLRVPQPLDLAGTVLITGGTGGLGGLLAQHLVDRHGVRRLLLMSRRGADAPGAAELRATLAERGCDVEITACDVSDRAALERVLAGVPAEHPLTAIFHTAGVLDDGVIPALDGARLRRVMAPKLDAAIHLDDLTREQEFAEFVLFSSAAGTLGTPGQGNYAAANSFLDALAQRRRAEGRPAMSLAFGLWERETGMTSHLSSGGEMRTGPLDLVPMPDELGLELIDAAREIDEPLLAPMRLDLRAVQARSDAGLLPSILSDLVRTRARSAAPGASPGGAGSLTRLLGGAPGADHERIVTDFVRTHTAAALGFPSPESIAPDQPFKELGIDSLSAVELRNRLARSSGLSLPATLVFDHPTPAAVAGVLRAAVGGEAGPAAPPPAPPADEVGANGHVNGNGSQPADSPATPSGLRDALHRTSRGVRRAGLAAHGSTWTRRLVPSSVALAAVRQFAAEARRRNAPSWREFVAFHEELLWHTPLAGTEADIAERALAEFMSCLEIFWRPWLMASGELRGLERLREAEAAGRGVVLAFAHYGPFHALMPISARYDLGTSIIISPHHYERLGAGYDARLARHSLAYLEMLGEGRSILRAPDGAAQSAFSIAESRLRAGEIVAVAFDIVGPLATPFLGRSVRLTNGPVRLARDTGAVIVPVVLRRHGVTPVAEFAEPIDPQRHADEATLQAALACRMEVWALELPEAVWPQQTQPGGAPLINGEVIDADRARIPREGDGSRGGWPRNGHQNDADRALT